MNRNNNSLTFMRFSAASLVIFYHSWDLLGLPEKDPISRALLSVFGLNLGGLAVAVFFFISGLLVTQSLMRDPNILNYTIRRAARVMPGLAVVVFITVFLVGPLVTTLEYGHYFSSGQTWHYLFKTIVPISEVAYRLPGVFSEHAFPSVNGSLWTLPVEIHMYTLLAVLFWLGLIKDSSSRLLLVAIVCASLILAFGPWQSLIDGPERNIMCFGFGIYAALKKCSDRQIVITVPIILGCLAWGSEIVVYVAVALLIAVLTVFVARRMRFLWSWGDWFGDLSYGIYIWGFLVQQVVIKYSDLSNPWSLFLVSWLIAGLIAAASWRFVEEPALRLTRGWIRSRG